jgi:hypothetical protein
MVASCKALEHVEGCNGVFDELRCFRVHMDSELGLNSRSKACEDERAPR